jgi:hypothetical protein
MFEVRDKQKAEQCQCFFFFFGGWLASKISRSHVNRRSCVTHCCRSQMGMSFLPAKNAEHKVMNKLVSVKAVFASEQRVGNSLEDLAVHKRLHIVLRRLHRRLLGVIQLEIDGPHALRAPRRNTEPRIAQAKRGAVISLLICEARGINGTACFC